MSLIVKIGKKGKKIVKKVLQPAEKHNLSYTRRIERIKTDRRICAMTFDDGPSKTTPDVLSALNAAGVHATFFVVATGYNEKYLPLLTEAVSAGHQIALHSASHEYSDIYRSSDAYWEDIALLKERIAPYVDAERKPK